MAHKPIQAKGWSQLFANCRGQWVALADDEVTVLASAAKAKAALAASAAKGAARSNPQPRAGICAQAHLKHSQVIFPVLPL
jgi:hypothetical protein